MYFEEFVQGIRLALDSVVINKNDMVDFARKYDNLPIHTDEKYAESSLFGQLIAPG